MGEAPNPHHAARPSEIFRPGFYPRVSNAKLVEVDGETLIVYDGLVATVASELSPEDLAANRATVLRGVFSGFMDVPPATLRGMLSVLVLRDVERLMAGES